MTVIISIIINFFKKKLLSFLKSKYFIYFLIIGIVFGYISFLNCTIKSKDKKIKSLEKEIYTAKIEISNITALKNINFEKRQIYIDETFKSSSNLINEIENKNLTKNELRALNTSIENYYKIASNKK